MKIILIHIYIYIMYTYSNLYALLYLRCRSTSITPHMTSTRCYGDASGSNNNDNLSLH